MNYEYARYTTKTTNKLTLGRDTVIDIRKSCVWGAGKLQKYGFLAQASKAFDERLSLSLGVQSGWKQLQQKNGESISSVFTKISLRMPLLIIWAVNFNTGLYYQLLFYNPNF
ncbi:MAG: hypothetical protein IPP60_13380 [Sphingobacteriales bacterium]|nr:hypothetical protein [Sphingobacteriales bacterium]